MSFPFPPAYWSVTKACLHFVVVFNEESYSDLHETLLVTIICVGSLFRADFVNAPYNLLRQFSSCEDYFSMRKAAPRAKENAVEQKTNLAVTSRRRHAT